MPDLPLVSVIVPCLNERDHIDSFLDSVARQRVDGFDMEVLIADGMSDDGTRERLRERAVEFPYRLRLIDNPDKYTPHALNRAIEASEGDIVLRLDVHTRYADDYIYWSVRLLDETGADNIGAPLNAVGDGVISEAVAAAMHSPLGMGGAAGHDRDYEGDIDTACFGCWKRQTLVDIGMFDEQFIRNQDDELNFRLTKNGYRVYQSPRLQTWYTPRNSLKRVFSQYRQYGYYKTKVIAKHREFPTFRPMVPAPFAAGVYGTLTLTALRMLINGLHLPTPRGLRRLTALGWGLVLVPYLLFLALATKNADSDLKPGVRAAFPLVLAAIHLGYGTGFLEGLIDMLKRSTGPRGTMTGITR